MRIVKVGFQPFNLSISVHLIQEKVVFHQYLLAPAFFWEDVFSFAVIALHSLYLITVWTEALPPNGQMILALVAYSAYAINAAQFIRKLRLARQDVAVQA